MATGIKVCRRETQAGGGERECQVRQLIFELGDDFQADTGGFFPIASSWPCWLTQDRKGTGLFSEPRWGNFTHHLPSPLAATSPSPSSQAFLLGHWAVPRLVAGTSDSLPGPMGDRTGASCH